MRKKIKVLIIQGYAYQRGGPVTFLRHLVKHLDRSKFEPIVLFLSEGELVAEFQSMGVKVRVINSGKLSNVILTAITVFRILRLIYKERIDIVLSNDWREHIYGGTAAYFAGIPATIFLQGFPVLSLPAKLSLAVPATSIFADSSPLERTISQWVKQKCKTYLVYHGIEIPNIKEKASLREELDFDADVPIITQVASLMQWKGHKYLINAVPKVIKYFPTAKFIIIGDAPFDSVSHRSYASFESYKESLKQLVKNLGIESSIEFMGYRENFLEIIGASDIVVHPSVYEPLAFVVIEALGYGKPVITTNAGGIKEIIENGVDGILIPPKNSGAIAEAIINLLKNPALCEKLGVRARKKVEKIFRVEREISELEDIWQSVLHTP